MTTIKTASNATSIMQAVLPRSVTPLDIARRDECTIMSVMRPDFLVGDVSSIADIAGGGFFDQTTGSSQGSKVSSDALGRETLGFADDQTSFYTSTKTVDYGGAFSMLAVFKPDSFPSIGLVLGNENVTTNLRVGLTVISAGRLRARVGDGTSASSVLTAGNWYAAIMSYDGGSEVTLEVLGDVVAANSTATDVVATSVSLGSSNAGFGFDGQIDMAAMFDVELHDAANAALLADVKSMLSQFYGAAVTGL